jgi:Tfp pilus assembly protein PilO
VFWGAGSVDTALAGQYEKAAEITSDARSISRIPNLSDLHIEIPSASGASNPN